MKILNEMTATGFGMFREARSIIKSEFDQVLQLSDGNWLDNLSLYAMKSNNERLKTLHAELARG